VRRPMARMGRVNARNRHIPAVLLAAVLWGTTGTVAHQAPDGSRQLVVGLSTFGFGGILLFALDTRVVLRTLSQRSLWPVLTAGTLGVVGYASLYYVSMKLIGVAGGNALALGSGPVWAALFEFFGDRHAPSRGSAIASAITVIGVVLLGTAAHSGTGQHPVAGVACAVGAGCGYGLYSWAGARLIAHGQPSRAAMAGIFVLASVVLVPALLVIGLGPLTHPRGVLVLAYLAALPMAAAYLLFGYGLRHMDASRAMTLALAEPVVATLLATQVLGEHLGGQAWVGLGVIGVGLVLVAALERQATQPGDATVPQIV
jgi:drug/metabolite transporter, DME family